MIWVEIVDGGVVCVDCFIGEGVGVGLFVGGYCVVEVIFVRVYVDVGLVHLLWVGL